MSLHMFTSQLTYKATTLAQRPFSPEASNQQNISTDLSCVTAVWDINSEFEWVLIPCNYSQVTPILICHSNSTSKVSSVEGDSTIVYVNQDSKRYPEMCTGQPLFYHCHSRTLSNSISGADLSNTRIGKAMRRIFYRHQCNEAHDLVCVLSSVIPRKPASLIPVVSVAHVEGTLLLGEFVCSQGFIGFGQMCYQHVYSAMANCSQTGHEYLSLNELTGSTMYPQTHGLCLLQESISQISWNHSCSAWQFQCDNNECVAESWLLDGTDDCLDGSDERQPVGNHSECGVHYFQCADGACVPWHLYCNGHHDCDGGDDEHGCSGHTSDRPTLPIAVNVSIALTYRCGLTDAYIGFDRYMDSWPDCPLFTSLGDYHTMLPFTYNVSDEIPSPVPGTYTQLCSPPMLSCRYLSLTSRPCFPITRLCMFDTVHGARLKYCSNGGHLMGCHRASCPGLFKCHQSYCLPLSRVCDSVPDCPDGDDEEGCSGHPPLCPGMLRCKEAACVHPSHVCDGITDCHPHGDDEGDCDREQCPDNCHCAYASMYCTDSRLSTVNCAQYKSIVITGNLNSPLLLIENAQSVYYLNISGNEIQLIPLDMFRTSRKVLNLDMSRNKLNFIGPDDLVTLRSLTTLNMSRNVISEIDERAFLTLVHLQILDLSRNSLMVIGEGTFDYLYSLRLLILAHNNLIVVHFNIALLKSLQRVDIFDNTDIRRAYINWPRGHGWRENGRTCRKCFFKTSTDHCTCRNEPIAGFPVLHRGLSWIVGLYLTVGSFITFLWRLTRPMPVSSKAVVSRDACCFLMGANTIMVDLGSNIATDHELNIVCMVGAMVQYTAMAVYYMMGVLHIVILYVLTKHWTRSRVSIAWRMKLVSFLAWFHMVMVDAVSVGLFYGITGHIPDMGETCSMPVTTPSNLLHKSLLGYLLLVHVVGLFLAILFSRRLLINVSRTDEVERAGCSTDTDDEAEGDHTNQARKLILNKILRMHLGPNILTIPVIACTVANFGHAPFSFKLSAIMTTLVFNLPFLYSATKSMNEMCNKTCTTEVKENIYSSDDEYMLGATHIGGQSVADTAL